MKLPNRNFTLTAFFVVLTLIAAATVYSLQQTPDQQTISKTIATYTSTANYDYTAYLNPNTIYPNKTTLKPDEGTIYTKFTKQIDISLTYAFDTTITSTATIQYNITQTMKTDAWQYTISTTPTTNTNQKTIQINLPTLDKTQLDQIKAQLDNETGVTTSLYNAPEPYYNIEITPTFIIDANTQAGPIHQIFQPTLTISSNHTENGDTITIDDLQQTQQGQLMQNQQITNEDVLNQRYASYALLATSIIGLSCSGLYQWKHKPTQAKIATEKLIKPYKDLIVEATDSSDAVTAVINVENLTELAKAAEILARPIFHTSKNQEDTFYIIENSIKYQHKTKTPTETKAEPSTKA
jgi:hypothetical protein